MLEDDFLPLLKGYLCQGQNGALHVALVAQNEPAPAVKGGPCGAFFPLPGCCEN